MSMPMTDRIVPIQSERNAMPLSVICTAGERVRQRVAAPRDLARRHAEHARLVLQQVDAEVLLQEREAAIHPRLQALALLLRILGLGRVGVEPHAIAELAAEHLPARDAAGLAGQIHQRHLDAAHAAGLSGGRAELLDPPEDLVDVAGVLAEQPALQDERVRLAGPVAHLAPADEPLVGVDADDRTRHRRLDHDRHAQVRDLERRGLRRALHVRLHDCRVFRGLGLGRSRERRRRRAASHRAART